MHVELVAAHGKLWEGTAHQVSAPGSEGSLGVLPGHVPMLTALGEGEVHIQGGESGGKRVRVEGGFLSVDHDRVTIVTDSAQVQA
nr:F0F1 ATP synthase subunit epsilon [Kineosphaera limosa]